MKNKFSAIILFALMAVVISSCQKDDEIINNGNGIPTGEGSVKVALTDGPFPFNTCTEANVEITKIEVRTENGEFVVLQSGSASYNFVDLTNGVTAQGGTTNVSTGTYVEARITCGSASCTFDDNSSYEANYSAASYTIDIEPALVVGEGENSEILFDLDLGNSFSFYGFGGIPLTDWFGSSFVNSCTFDPHFRVCDFDQTGVINGNVTVGGTPYLNANCTISHNGSTIATHTEADGTFSFIGVDDGTYSVSVETENGASGSSTEVVISGTNTATCTIEL